MERRTMIIGNKNKTTKSRANMKKRVINALKTARDVLFVCVHDKGRDKGKVQVISGVTPDGGFKIHLAIRQWDRQMGMDLSKAMVASLLRDLKNASTIKVKKV